jgi:polyisoprenoid-binding protein YceI
MVLLLLALTSVACSVLSEPAAPSEELEAAAVEVEAPAAGSASAEAGGLTVYQIDPAESHVRFELDEVLRGSPKTVVGSTDQVSGEIAADLDDLSSAEAGLIQINARTFATDNNFRNRALNNKILNSGEYEFITFEPTAVNGLPSSAAVGDALEFSIDGDLTIRDITLLVTFAVSASPVSETQLAGSASTTVNWTDFDLKIPSVQNVADVEEEVELYIDFVANAS